MFAYTEWDENQNKFGPHNTKTKAKTKTKHEQLYQSFKAKFSLVKNLIGFVCYIYMQYCEHV